VVLADGVPDPVRRHAGAVRRQGGDQPGAPVVGGADGHACRRAQRDGRDAADGGGGAPAARGGRGGARLRGRAGRRRRDAAAVGGGHGAAPGGGRAAEGAVPGGQRADVGERRAHGRRHVHGRVQGRGGRRRRRQGGRARPRRRRCAPHGQRAVHHQRHGQADAVLGLAIRKLFYVCSLSCEITVIYEHYCIVLLANGLLQRKTGRHDHRSVSLCSAPVSGHYLVRVPPGIHLPRFFCELFLTIFFPKYCRDKKKDHIKWSSVPTTRINKNIICMLYEFQ
jgi:hypothetical protein